MNSNKHPTVYHKFTQLYYSRSNWISSVNIKLYKYYDLWSEL